MQANVMYMVCIINQLIFLDIMVRSEKMLQVGNVFSHPLIILFVRERRQVQRELEERNIAPWAASYGEIMRGTEYLLQ